MAEQLGGLAQANPAASVAGGGNVLQTQMFEQMMAKGNADQDYLTQMRKVRDAEMQNYVQQVHQSQLPENNEAQMWGDMAGAASSVAPTWGNIGAMLGKTGQAYGQHQAMEQAQNIKSQQDLVKEYTAEVRSLEGKNQQASLIKAMYGGNKGANPTIKVVDGKLIKYDPISGTTEVLSGSQDQIKAKLLKTFFDRRSENEDPDALINAQKDVEVTLSKFGGTTVTGKDNAIPGTQTTGQIAPARVTAAAGDVPEIAPSLQQELSTSDAATAQRLIARIQANPATAPNDTATLEKLLMKYQPAATSEGAPKMPYLDKPQRKLEEATGSVAGKALGEEHQNLQVAAESSSQLFSQLDLLKKLYQTPNMPEGQLASSLQNIRSGLKTIGIDVGPEVGAADLVSSISGKMALLTRTADGKNLMPGAMSDFEQKILRNLVPGLEGTAEGRAALIDFMQAMAKARIRFAEEANKMAGDRGILPPTWNERKQRIMKEEMAKMAHINADIAARFAGAK